MENEILNLIEKCKNSSFNKYNYEVSIDIENFIRQLLSHVWYKKVEEIRKDDVKIPNNDMEFNEKLMLRITPEFQRANNKWTKKMQRKFIENLLSGVKSELLFFKFNDDEDAQIIDGLQRITSIINFFNGKIKPFGFSYSDLKEKLRMFYSSHLTIKIYTFSNWEEVGKFYIDYNENITHSKKDIQKAKDWFLNEHGVIL